MKFTDKSGQPRNHWDIEQAIHEAKKALIDTKFCASRPNLAVMLPTILDVLKETLQRREHGVEPRPCSTPMCEGVISQQCPNCGAS